MKAILFDLDGTLLPVGNDFFFGPYLRDISGALPGVDPKLLGRAIVDILQDVMTVNTPGTTVETAFMSRLAQRVDRSVEEIMPHLNEYYQEGFPRLGRDITPMPEVRKALDAARAKGYRVALTTNPVFPAVATRERMRWAGLSPEDFEFVTYFEHCCHTKPHKAYFEHEVLARLDLPAGECLMVGNDVHEDMVPANALGMSTFLLTPYAIGDRSVDVWDDEGDYLELLRTIESLPDVML